MRRNNRRQSASSGRRQAGGGTGRRAHRRLISWPGMRLFEYANEVALTLFNSTGRCFPVRPLLEAPLRESIYRLDIGDDAIIWSTPPGACAPSPGTGVAASRRAASADLELRAYSPDSPLRRRRTPCQHIPSRPVRPNWPYLSTAAPFRNRSSYSYGAARAWNFPARAGPGRPSWGNLPTRASLATREIYRAWAPQITNTGPPGGGT